MKALPLILTLASCGLLYAATSKTDVAKNHVQAMRADGSVAEVMRILAKDGDFCKVDGHAWDSTMITVVPLSGEYPEQRKCKVCNKVETKQPSEWK